MQMLRTTVLIALAALLPGCVAAAAAGAAAAYGYVRYSDNLAYRDYRVGVDDAFDAAASVLRQNGHYVPPDTRYADVDGHLVVDDVEVTVRANSKLSTRIEVRVGTFSNAAHRERAGAILDAVAVRLGG